LTWVDDGLSNTTLLYEKALLPYLYAPRSGIIEPTLWQQMGGCWALANDPSWSGLNPLNSTNSHAHYSQHPQGAQQVMCDGSVRLLAEGTELGVVRAIDSRSGGEPIDAKAWQ
jgi:hypothetical protein